MASPSPPEVLVAIALIIICVAAVVFYGRWTKRVRSGSPRLVSWGDRPRRLPTPSRSVPNGSLALGVAVLALIVALFVATAGGMTGPAGPSGPPGATGGNSGGGGGGGEGSPGADGFTALIATTSEAPGPNCADGGEFVKSGLDNGDGGGISRDSILQAGEQDLLFYTCDGPAGANGAAGADGYNAITKVTAESPGVNCAAGGQMFEAGLDNGDGGGTARNGVLEAGERDVGPVYTCHGAAGATGTDGFDTIVKMTAESPGGNCAAGGQQYESGLDNGDGGGTARNGVLEAGERDVGPTYICAGVAGSDGAAGRDQGLLYTYNTGTSGDPGVGKFGFDTTTLSAIATLRISETDGDANGIAALIATWDDSTTATSASVITVLGNQAPTRLLVFKITGTLTDNGAYDSFPVSYITSAGSHANNDIDKVIQSRTGDKGADGAAGADGADGAGFTLVDTLTSAFTSTSTTGAEVTGLTNTLSSTGTYVFTYYLICRTAATTTGIDFGITFDSTQNIIIINMEYPDSGTSATTGIADGTVAGDGAELLMARSSTLTESTTAPNLNGITGVVTASEDFLVYITGIVITTGSGNLELWSATDVAASQVAIGIGSSVTVIKTG